ncbi:MAG: hypothetical protein ACOY4K_06590 [Pseudomonadota bacterium]
MTEDERKAVRQETSAACRAFMRRIGLKYPWLHPEFDPTSQLWRQRAVRAWNSLGRFPTLY